jgi:hypothetical protein
LKLSSRLPFISWKFQVLLMQRLPCYNRMMGEDKEMDLDEVIAE